MKTIQAKLNKIKKWSKQCQCYHCEQKLALAQALEVAVKALEAECKPFNFPDEDRPICKQALDKINTLLE